jgi:hypothetical protein
MAGDPTALRPITSSNVMGRRSWVAPEAARHTTAQMAIADTRADPDRMAPPGWTVGEDGGPLPPAPKTGLYSVAPWTI